MKFIYIFVISTVILEFSLLLSSFYHKYKLRRLDDTIFAHEDKIKQYQKHIENCNAAIDWCLYITIITGSVAIIYKTYIKYFG